MRLLGRVRPHLGLIAAGAAGGIWFLLCAGRLANPFHVETLLVDDWSTHLLGWLFFRHEGFHLPFGRVEGLLYPLGTTVGYTDSIPWMAFVFRLVSWALPTDFQFIGPFMLACFVMNGAVGAWLVRAVSPRQLDQALGGTLFALMPALLLRLGHPSLCAQGLVLVPLGLALRAPSDARSAKRMGLVALGLCALTAGLHPYLAVMTLAIAAPVPLKLKVIDRQLSWPWALGLLGAMPVALVLVFLFFGYYAGGVEKGGAGFGAFSADVATFTNPMSYSRFLAAKPQGGQQYEGFAYLGLGVLVAVALALVSLLVRFREARELPWRRLALFVPGILGTAAFSFANPWTWHGAQLLDLTSLYAAVPASLVGPFRSSGRFIWPLMYALVAFGVVGVVRLWRHLPWLPTALLAACLGLQLADVTQAPVAERFKPSQLTRFSSAGWASVDGRYEHLALVPAEIWSVCPGRAGYRGPLVIALAYHAYRHGLTFNSGYVARSSPDQLSVCQREEAAVLRGELDPKTVYVVWPDVAQQLLQRGAACNALDGLVVCVGASADDAFARVLRGASP